MLSPGSDSTAAPTAADAAAHIRPPSVLIVDDDAAIRHLFERWLSSHGYAVASAADGEQALEAVRQQPPDVVLLDVAMPKLSGVDVCRRIKQDSATRLTPVILVSAVDGVADRISGLAAGADDFLSKPVNPAELLTRVGAVVRVKRYTDDLDSAASIITTLATMIESRDGHSEGHCYRMANYAAALGRRLNLDADDMQALRRGGILHDIGMLAIPESVILKSGPLDPDEFDVVKTHTTVGDSLCANLRSLQPVRPIVRHHHERRDGSGYPDGLQGDAIPLLAQIIGIVDVYDAVTTKRAYQRSKSADDAIGILRREVDKGWRSHDLVEEFISLIGDGRLPS
ncbi:MAG: response regulator [Vicinamibacterales bacterium]